MLCRTALEDRLECSIVPSTGFLDKFESAVEGAIVGSSFDV